MNAPSPGIIATTMLNAHYKSHQDYLDAIAREMRVEYARVVEAGFVLQIDAPDLAMERVLLYQDASDAEFAKLVEQHVAALNRGLQGLPRDRVRLHDGQLIAMTVSTKALLDERGAKRWSASISGLTTSSHYIAETIDRSMLQFMSRRPPRLRVCAMGMSGP